MWNNCINNSGIWGPTRHLSLKITNSLAVFRLRKSLKTCSRLVGRGTWSQDLSNANLVRYHGAISLGCFNYCINICRAVSNVVAGPRPRREQPWVQATPSIMRWHLSGRVQCSHRTTTDDTNQSRDQATPSMSYCMSSEFRLHCHLLGNLSIRSSPFWQQWFSDHEKQ